MKFQSGKGSRLRVKFVIVSPALNLIIVSTANNHVDWDTANEQEMEVLEIVSRYILPAVDG